MKLVVVKWEDAVSESNWSSEDTVLKSTLKAVYTAGFLVRKDKKVISIALLMSDDKEDFSNWVNIPTSCVLSVDVIKEIDWEVKDA